MDSILEKTFYGIVAIFMFFAACIIILTTIALVSVSPWLALWPVAMVGFLGICWLVGSVIERWI